MNYKNISLGLCFLGALMSCYFYFAKENKEKASEEVRAPASESDVKSVQADTDSKIKATEVVTGQKEYSARRMVKIVSDKLISALHNGGILDRESILKEGKKDPQMFSIAIKEMLKELPLEQVEIRVQCISLLADVIQAMNQDTAISIQEKESVYSHMYDVVDMSLSSPELVSSKMFENLSEYQKKGYLHEGKIVEVDGQMYRSTLGEKAVSMVMTHLDPNVERSNAYRDSLSQKLGQSGSLALMALNKVNSIDIKKASKE